MVHNVGEEVSSVDAGAPQPRAIIVPDNPTERGLFYSMVAKTVIDAWETAYANLAEDQEPCQRCSGRDYRHGFGEDGADPGWCSACGGTGWVYKWDGEAIEAGAMYAASIAVELALSGGGVGQASTLDPSETTV